MNSLFFTLERVRFLSFEVSAPTGAVICSGGGQVQIELLDEQCLLSRESGRSKLSTGNELSFSNCYRWNFDPSGSIRLAHLRLGDDEPYFLVELLPQGNRTWASVNSHHCGEDAYSATLQHNSEELVTVEWVIKGPRKGEIIRTSYRITAT